MAHLLRFLQKGERQAEFAVLDDVVLLNARASLNDCHRKLCKAI